jgi:uncharacterized membrane protein YheB (UPF0754 family)
MEARYNDKIREFTEAGREDEMYEYMLQCIPFIKEYTEDVKEEVCSDKAVASLKITSRKGVQRKDIYKKYLSAVEDEGSEEVVFHKTLVFPCSGCGKSYTRIHDDITSEDICTECGVAEFVQNEDRLGFKEEQEMGKNIVYSYRRENHFNEWVSQFQAKESTSVPQDLIELLRQEFKKQKIKELSEITHEKVRALLKKLGKNKYYEHVPYITTILNGIKPPTMPQELEDKLRLMFHQVQKPFEKHRPSGRKNFLSYSYILYKFCELLGEDEYLPCFPLLKSKEKLYNQDKMWKSICTELQWEYIKT